MYIKSKSEVDKFFIWPQGTLEDVFKVKSLAQQNVWG